MISKNMETAYGTGDVKMKKQRKRAVVLLLAVAVLMGTPVSYTHLDVYKRQVTNLRK